MNVSISDNNITVHFKSDGLTIIVVQAGHSIVMNTDEAVSFAKIWEMGVRALERIYQVTPPFLDGEES